MPQTPPPKQSFKDGGIKVRRFSSLPTALKRIVLCDCQNEKLSMLTLPRSVEAQSNPRGIPLAPFVDDVEKFVDSRADIEPNLKKFQEMIAFVSLTQVALQCILGADWECLGGDRKYQFMEMNTQRRAAGLRDKIPDIQKTLDTVIFLESRKVRQPTITHKTKGEGRLTYYWDWLGLRNRIRVDLRAE